MSSTDGSPTSTGWKRRSSAASFSMCLRYSSSVVAPTARSSPRASIGLSRLAASTAPSAAPAPTIVCSSSMNRTIVPPASLISLRTAFRRSSNSPRYFEPASSAPMSSAMTRRSRSDSGTSPDDDALGEALDDRGLADAGLADQHRVVLRAAAEDLDDAADLVVAADDRVELALLGLSVRSRPNFSSAWNLSSGDWSVTGGGRGPRRSPGPARPCVAPAARRASPAREPWCAASASSRCSVETYSSLSSRISCSAARRTRTSSLDGAGGLAAGGQRRQRVEQGVDLGAQGAGAAPSLAQHGHDDAVRPARAARRAGAPG